MTNVSGWKENQRLHKLAIPNPATVRDVQDLVMMANRKYEEVHGTAPDYDDAYLIEADDEQIVATIKEVLGRG